MKIGNLFMKPPKIDYGLELNLIYIKFYFKLFVSEEFMQFHTFNLYKLIKLWKL